MERVIKILKGIKTTQVKALTKLSHFTDEHALTVRSAGEELINQIDEALLKLRPCDKFTTKRESYDCYNCGYSFKEHKIN